LNPLDPNVQSVEAVAQALDDLCDEVVLVGGCAAGLLYTSASAPPARVTFDVDVVAEVAVLADYYALERQFEKRGFKRDVSQDAPICRWRLRDLCVDLMPSDEKILGFSNRWYPHAIASALRVALPSGRPIRLISPAAFLATKFEAFATRGRSDLLSSHDFEDIINVLDGRSGIEEEVAASAADLVQYLAARFAEIVRHADFTNTLPGLVSYDEIHGDRVRRVRARIETIAALSAAR
jgi:hypothetical protein